MKTTQIESFLKLDRTTRYNMILNLLKQYSEGFTAREMAIMLFEIPDRNLVAPRLTELEKKGKVKVTGTRYDPITERNVSVYMLGGEEVDNKI